MIAMTLSAAVLDILGVEHRLARIIALAKEVFESEATAKDWLNRPNRALGGTKPLELLDTDAGVEQVVDLLNRIDYVVYS
jgi:putative toxin-antitoxin system antitoxin component (TIGR02293 family)